MFVHRLQCRLSGVQREREQTGTRSLRGVNGSFTYFTTCIEGGVGRVNDSVALHGGNVGLDNLQLQMTTTTKQQANNKVVKTQWVIKMGQKRRGEKKKNEREEQEEKRQRSELAPYWLRTSQETRKQLWHRGTDHVLRKQDGTFSQIYFKKQHRNTYMTNICILHSTTHKRSLSAILNIQILYLYLFILNIKDVYIYIYISLMTKCVVLISRLIKMSKDFHVHTPGHLTLQSGCSEQLGSCPFFLCKLVLYYSQ